MLLVLVSLLGSIALMVFLSESVLNITHKLQEQDPWLWLIALGLITGITSCFLFFSWRYWRHSKINPQSIESPTLIANSSAELEQHIAQAEQRGVQTSDAAFELDTFLKRQQQGEVNLVVAGEISAGKSSLINALFPGANIAKVGVEGGITQRMTRYSWTASSGDKVILIDLPGFNDVSVTNADQLEDEAMRAHLILFVCDSDLNREQHIQLERFAKHHKPIIVAINKSDLYSAADLKCIQESIASKLAPFDHFSIVTVKAQSQQPVTIQHADGSETTETRSLPAHIEPLLKALQKHLDEQADLLNQLHRHSVFLLASEKLATATQQWQLEQSNALVTGYTHKAIVAALAAIAPGSDLIIQGILASKLVHELAAIYNIPVKQLDIDSFIKLIGGSIKRSTAVVLAIAGNALKAFPGLGTLTGGLIHAIAYGMIFDGLGRALVKTMASRGDLRTQSAVKQFEEELSENLESSAKRIAKLAVQEAFKR